MKLKKGFTLRQIVGENVLVAEGVENVDFDKMIVLNSTAKFLWESLQGKDFTVDDAVKLLTDEYDVTAEKAREDVEKLFTQFKEAGILMD